MCSKKEIAWFTPKEVLEKVYDNKISMGFLLAQCNKGIIPCKRMGTGKRKIILIPATFVRAQLEEAFGKDSPVLQEVMYA